MLFGGKSRSPDGGARRWSWPNPGPASASFSFPETASLYHIVRHDGWYIMASFQSTGNKGCSIDETSVLSTSEGALSVCYKKHDRFVLSGGTAVAMLAKMDHSARPSSARAL